MTTVGRRFTQKNNGKFDSARLKHRVTIRQKSTTRDGFGQPIASWADLVNLSADVRFENGKEFNAAGRQVAETVASVRIRTRGDITNAMRLVFKGVEYNITAVLPGREPEYMDLAVTSGVNGG